MKIAVIQPGARLHYGVPEIFAKAGALSVFYTDLHAEHIWLRAIDCALPDGFKPKLIRRLLGRRLPSALPVNKVRDRPVETLLNALGMYLGVQRNADTRVVSKLLGDLEKSDIGPGDIVYTVLINEDLEVMRRLKARGVKIVHECMIGPDVGLLIKEEQARFPGLERKLDRIVIDAGRARDREKYALADLVIVPSKFTARAVQELAPQGTRIANIPYGLDLALFSQPSNPEAGRVLAVGAVGLRKGHPDLAEATRQLLRTNPEISVRVVGHAPDGLLQRPEMKGPTYVGQVPRTQVTEEFARADVLVFPTICDSFGLVILEAMAMGIPVVSSENCGDIVRDGVEGCVVPIRNPEALARAVARITSDRRLREEMSVNARNRARDFSLDAYGARLLAAMERV